MHIYIFTYLCYIRETKGRERKGREGKGKYTLYTYVQKGKTHIASHLSHKINVLYLVHISIHLMLAELINRINKFILSRELCWILMTISHLICSSNSARQIFPTWYDHSTVKYQSGF